MLQLGGIKGCINCTIKGVVTRAVAGSQRTKISNRVYDKRPCIRNNCRATILNILARMQWKFCLPNIPSKEKEEKSLSELSLLLRETVLFL